MKFLFILVLTPIVFGWGARRNKVSDEELQDFTEDLLNLDFNNAAQYVGINFPPKPLVIYNPAVDFTTISDLLQLYISNSHDACKWAEEDSLLDSFMATDVMKYTMWFLAEKGLVGRDPKTQKDRLKLIWFTKYNRKGSCGFHHVFLGELKEGKMSGMHNWIFFDYETSKKEAEYLAYIKSLELGGKGAILELRYKWANVMKPVSSMFVGTSPELEMALYTVCFLVHPDEQCQVRMAGQHFSIRTYSYDLQSKNIISSAFPDITHSTKVTIYENPCVVNTRSQQDSFYCNYQNRFPFFWNLPVQRQ